MASAAMIHFGLDTGKVVCFLLGKYTGQYQDARRTLDAIRDHITWDNYGHIKRILLNGWPAQLTFKEPSSNKLEFISHGNSKSFVEDPQLVQKIMNKEDRYSHLVPMYPLLCKLSPYLCHTMQVWLPVLCLVLHCAWSNVWVWCRPFVPLQSLGWWGKRSPLPCYGLQTLCLGCILVFHCLSCSCCNSARVLRKPSILLWFPLLLIYQM